MKYTQKNKIITRTLGIGALLLLPVLAFAAQETFVSLTPLPGVTSATSFSGFLNAAFRIGLALAATLAVVMITIGGLEYMTTDSISGKSEGRERIQNAVIGLLIALLIWLILYTINPNLLNFNINIEPSPGSSTQVSPRTSTTKGGAGLGGSNSTPTDYEAEAAGIETGNGTFGSGTGGGNQ